jgi:hypothetical protein
MKVSLKGLISSSCYTLEKAKGLGPGYAYTLNEMLENLQEAFDRYHNGDNTGIDQFSKLYCMETRPPKPKGES